MGKKSNSGKKNGKTPSHVSTEGIKYLPFVSVCTVTFNRRPFWERTFEIFRKQNYPKNRMEWIIIDDGTDKIRDLVEKANIPQIKYIALPEKLTLGAKRNLSHTHCKGSIIVYADDDDYYPPERVSHAVETLMANPTALCAGSSELYVYFKHIEKMYQCGPYSPTHATAGTFAFRKELLEQTRYEDNVALAEEKFFLKDYTIPFVQLDPMKTILVFSHIHNTFDKKKMLKDCHPQFLKESPKTVDDFIKGTGRESMKKFFMEEIENLLEMYEPGDPKHKPDALQQIKDIEIKREKMIEEQNSPESIRLAGEELSLLMIRQPNSEPRRLTQNEVLLVVQNQKTQMEGLMRKIVEYTGIFEEQKRRIELKIKEGSDNMNIFVSTLTSLGKSPKEIDELFVKPVEDYIIVKNEHEKVVEKDEPAKSYNIYKAVEVETEIF
jgi:hypothetical protein